MPASPTPRLRLSRSRRIKLGRDFTRTRTAGERIVCGCLIANWFALDSHSLPRVGVVTSRKLGNAVIRSRARRLLREAFRLHQHELARPIDLVLVARHSINGKRFQQVEVDFLRALQQARLLKGMV